MANKKISQLDSRASLSLSDLMAVGDPTTGYLYKTTISDLKTLTGAGVISFNGRFGAVSPAEGDYTLNQLGDVIITSPSNDQVLRYNGSNWVNAALPGETDTLDSVTDRGNTTTNGIEVGQLVSTGLVVASGAIYTNVGFYSNLNGNLRYTFDGNNLVLKAGTSTSNDYMTVFGATGNVAIGTVTDAGYKLDVNGSIRASSRIVSGLGTFVNNCLMTYISNHCGSSGFLGFGFANTDNPGLADSVFDIYQLPSAAPQYALFNFKHIAADSTGNANALNIVAVNTVINQTNGSNGIVRGFYYNPTLTAINGTHYAFESTAGKIKISDLAGTGSRILVADADGVVSASTSALSGFVPYTGATTNVELGNKYLSVYGQTNTAYLSVGSAGASMQYGQSIIKLIDHQNGGSLSLLLRPVGLDTGIDRIIQLPNADGVIALTSNLSSYVPYTGATASVNIGSNTLTAFNLTATSTVRSPFIYIDGASTQSGQIHLKQGTSLINPEGYSSIGGTATGFHLFSGGKTAILNNTSLTSVRTFTFPDASGTLALTSNIPSVSGTSGRVPLFTSTNAIGNSQIYDNGTTVGIGSAVTGQHKLVSVLDTDSISAYAIMAWGTGTNTGGLYSTVKSGNILLGNSEIAGVSATRITIANTGAVVTESTVQASAYRLTGMTAGSGALYYSSAANRVTVANYNASGIVVIETNGGAATATFGGATYANDFVGTLRATGAATFSSSVTASGTAFINSALNNTVITTSDATNITNGFNLLGSSSYWGIRTSTNGNFNIDVFGAGVPKNALTIVQSNGYVGINTTNPSSRLNVSGINDAVKISGGGTSALWQTWSNTGGNYFVGISASDGNGLLGGQNPYSFCLVTESARDMAFGTNNTERIRIHSNGQISINASVSRGYKFNLNSGSDYGMEIRQTGGDNNYIPLTITHEFTSSLRQMIVFQVGGYGPVGKIECDNTNTFYRTSSDYRLKEDLKDYCGLDIISNIRTYDFKWKSQENKRDYGVIAHELQAILPAAVGGIKDELDINGKINPQGVDYSKIVPVLVKAIQEQQAQIETLKAKLN